MQLSLTPEVGWKLNACKYGPQLPLDAGTPSPSHGGVCDRRMPFPLQSAASELKLHCVMEFVPRTTHLHSTFDPAQIGKSSGGLHLSCIDSAVFMYMATERICFHKRNREI